jgi:hypothetical protein
VVLQGAVRNLNRIGLVPESSVWWCDLGGRNQRDSPCVHEHCLKESTDKASADALTVS